MKVWKELYFRYTDWNSYYRGNFTSPEYNTSSNHYSEQLEHIMREEIKKNKYLEMLLKGSNDLIMKLELGMD